MDSCLDTAFVLIYRESMRQIITKFATVQAQGKSKELAMETKDCSVR